MTGASVQIGIDPIGLISPRLYGAFAEHLGRCCYGGLWVGPASAIPNVDGFRTDVVAALRDLPTPLIRWPGGCYADHYHWRDGIGGADERPRTIGTSCGVSVPDGNALGTHEFMRFCELTGAEAYLAGNVGTGSVQELCDWVMYVNADVDSSLARLRATNGRAEPWGVRLWGIGNESWDCGGRFDAVSYAHEYRRYAAMLRHIDPKAELVAVGLEDNTLPESHLENDWNAKLLTALGPSADLVDHLSVHKYWIYGGPETDFGEADYYALLAEADATEGLIERTARTIATLVPPSHRIGIALDEWGVWHPEARDWGPGNVPRRTPATFEQAGTLRDALAVAVALEGFHRQCNVLSMANLAQVVNVLHAFLLTDGTACIKTPTYHAFSLHSPHIGARAYGTKVETDVTLPGGRSAVSATASRSEDGAAVTVINRHFDRSSATDVQVAGLQLLRAQLLAADAANAVNTTQEPDCVSPRPLEVTEMPEGHFLFTLPAHSMATLEFRTNHGRSSRATFESGVADAGQ
ncbi:MAG: alpha-N-arabinofuranosidase [Candidatus Limnocylindrales bacterium]